MPIAANSCKKLPNTSWVRTYEGTGGLLELLSQLKRDTQKKTRKHELSDNITLELLIAAKNVRLERNVLS